MATNADIFNGSFSIPYPLIVVFCLKMLNDNHEVGIKANDLSFEEQLYYQLRTAINFEMLYSVMSVLLI